LFSEFFFCKEEKHWIVFTTLSLSLCLETAGSGSSSWGDF
jgi:hypothetical protein